MQYGIILTQVHRSGDVQSFEEKNFSIRNEINIHNVTFSHLHIKYKC